LSLVQSKSCFQLATFVYQSGSLSQQNQFIRGVNHSYALLTVEPKSKPYILKVELDGNTHAWRMRYCAFTNNVGESSVIREALKYVSTKMMNS
jgi:hypothetical protein